MAFLSSFSSFAIDRESAIREITRGQELMGRVRSLLLAVAPTSNHWPPTAELLFEEAFHSFTVSRSILQKPRGVAAVEQSGAHAPLTERGGSGGSFNVCSSGKRKDIVVVDVEDEEDGVHKASTSMDASTKVATVPCHGGQQRRSHGEKSSNAAKFPRVSMDSRTMVATTVPYDDGYQWRKYGEKLINGAKFPRSYFRCTHRNEHGCQASKLVQQVDNNYPPTFLVSYNNQHTCKLCRKIDPSIVPTLKRSHLMSMEASCNKDEEANECAPQRTPGEKKASFGLNLRIGLPGAGNKIVKQEVEVNTTVKWK